LQATFKKEKDYPFSYTNHKPIKYKWIRPYWVINKICMVNSS